MTTVVPRPVVTRPYPVRRQVKGSAVARILRTTDAKLNTGMTSVMVPKNGSATGCCSRPRRSTSTSTTATSWSRTSTTHCSARSSLRCPVSTGDPPTELTEPDVDDRG
jgi:hypothetical protein